MSKTDIFNEYISKEFKAVETIINTIYHLPQAKIHEKKNKRNTNSAQYI